jgi:hypothetical protein
MNRRVAFCNVYPEFGPFPYQVIESKRNSKSYFFEGIHGNIYLDTPELN